MQPSGAGSGGGGTSVGFNIAYFMSILGILRCVELIFSIVVLATSAVCFDHVCSVNAVVEIHSLTSYTKASGMGFITFVGVIAMLGNLCIIILRTLNLLYERAWANLGEMIYSASCVLLFFVSLIIAAVYTSKISSWSVFHDPWAACAAFSCFNMILYGVDVGFRLLKMRRG